jgi:hypothetical protein
MPGPFIFSIITHVGHCIFGAVLSRASFGALHQQWKQCRPIGDGLVQSGMKVLEGCVLGLGEVLRALMG